MAQNLEKLDDWRRWVCTHRVNGLPFGITIPLPTDNHDEAERIVRLTWPGVSVEGRLVEVIDAGF